MTEAIIITFSLLLLIAYVFELTSSRIKIPTVIFLLFLGWVVKQLTMLLGIHFPDFSPFLPVLGTVGLILIVLEASLELEIDKSKTDLLIKSFLGAITPMLALAFSLAFLFMLLEKCELKTALLNAITLSVISSAIAIPSAKNFSNYNKEFVVYESSLSDILGILIFNFLAFNETINIYSVGNFGLQLFSAFVVSIIATVVLLFLLNKIEHHIKFIPMILLIILLYEVSKVLHLPGLIIVLIFGLSISNLEELKNIKLFQIFNLNIDELLKEIIKFKELTIEGTFLIRSLFFLLFGYLIETSEILNINTLLWAILIVFLIFTFRAIQLKLSRLPLKPLLFIAPRGLITILLFLSIEPKHSISLVNKSLITQVIILTALPMLFSSMTEKSQKRLIGGKKLNQAHQS